MTLEAIDKVLQQLDNDKEKLTLAVENNAIAISNLNKEMWPSYQDQAAITKRDYIKYLAEISPYILPHLRDRLITFIRFPNGINGSKFYQKHWRAGRPQFVSIVASFTDHANQDQDFLICNNLSTLLWLGQIADLELHTSHTRNNASPDGAHLPLTFTGSVENLESSLLNYPDYLIFDLDPYLYSGKEKIGDEPELHRQGFQRGCEVALWIKDMLDKLGITAYVKTSGRTGLHIYVPIIREIDYNTVRAITEILGRYILKEHSDAVTMDWSIVKRTGKVFLDHNMNARSKTLASIYSPRVAPEASISTPLRWDELGKVYPTDFTIRTVPHRLRLIGDLWADILEHKNDLLTLLKASQKSLPDSDISEERAAAVVAKKQKRSSKRT
jgi:bifunctional non-homologous end joining protein LigD